MASVTIRNLADDVVERIKIEAARHGRSMEHELRLLLQQRYARRAEVLERIRDRWRDTEPATGDEIAAWRRRGRE